MKMGYEDWSWISWNWVLKIDHGSHQVVLRELIIDIMKSSYEDWSSISWLWVIRIDHGSHEVVWWELIIDILKFSYEDWSWISWSWAIRIDQGPHEVMLWGLIIYLRLVARIYHRCHEVDLSRWIINLMKLNYKDWSWMSWRWIMRIDHRSQEVEL